MSELRGHGYVDVALRGYVEYTADQRKRLDQMLTHGFPRADGLPGWNPNVEDLGPVEWLTGEHNRALIGRAVLTAIYADLDSSNRFEAFRGGESGESARRRANRYRLRGRVVLHRLGVWPWSEEPYGRLPHGWNGHLWPLDGLYVERFDSWRATSLDSVVP